MPSLSSVFCRLNGNNYRLARQSVMAQLGMTARNWSVEHVPVTTKREPRSNVRKGDLPGEWVITYDNWSAGMVGDRLAIPGAVHYAENVNLMRPGRMGSGGYQARMLTSTNTHGADPAVIVAWTTDPASYGAVYYVMMGRYRAILHDGVVTPVDDWGAGYTATDAIVFNGEMVVGFGGSTNEIYRLSSADVWAQATDATYANFFARVENKLWRATATSQVSNIDATDDPRTLTNWGGTQTVGDASVPITDLNGQGERILVSKEDGLYFGEKDIWTNALEHLRLQRHPNNGKGTLVIGDQIYYPYQNGGLALWASGNYYDVSPRNQYNSVNVADTPPGYNVTALCNWNNDVLAALEPSFLPQADPTGFLKTTDNESSFTSYLTQVSDNDATTTASLTNLSTAANGDYFYVGYSSKFYGVWLDILAANNQTATITVQFWDAAAGGSWIVVSTIAYDGTASGGQTLNKSGALWWDTTAAEWDQKTINGTEAYWVRISVSAAIGGSSGMTIREARIITAAPKAHVIRGIYEGGGRMTWVPFGSFAVDGPITAMIAGGSRYPEHNETGTLVVASRNGVWEYHIPPLSFEPLFDWNSGLVVMPKDDAGMPLVNKEWIDVMVQGKTIDANHTYDLYHRTDETASWGSADASNVATNFTRTALSSVTGRAFQLRVDLDNVTHDSPTEINCIEVRFRELPTEKHLYRMLLEVADNQAGPDGEGLPDGGTQLTNLVACVGASTKTLINPLGTSKTVSVWSAREVEAYQDETGWPGILVEVIASEA